VILFRALVPLLVIVVAAFGSIRLMDSVGPDIAGSGSSSTGTPAPIDASSKGSLVKAANFAKVLVAIRKDFGSEAKVVNLRMEPARVDVQVPQGTRAVLVQYDSNGDQRFRTEIGSDLSKNPNAASITRIPANAPQRIMKKIAKKTGQPVDDLSYMVITTFGDGVGWYVSLKKGEQTTWRAELDGSKVRAS
jgi:hypothetical protein